MNKKMLTGIIGVPLITLQLVVLRDYLPFLSAKLLVKGMSCTCPDTEVISGEAQLKAMTCRTDCTSSEQVIRKTEVHLLKNNSHYLLM